MKLFAVVLVFAVVKDNLVEGDDFEGFENHAPAAAPLLT